jgi:hypothetical protein
MVQKKPFVRGFQFTDSMKDSYRCLMKSADLAVMPKRSPKALKNGWLKNWRPLWCHRHATAMVFGVVLAMGLFMVVPTVIIGFSDNSGWRRMAVAYRSGLKNHHFYRLFVCRHRMAEFTGFLSTTVPSTKPSRVMKAGRS